VRTGPCRNRLRCSRSRKCRLVQCQRQCGHVQIGIQNCHGLTSKATGSALTAGLGLATINGLSGHDRATLRKAPQLVLDFEPRKLILRPYVIIRTHSLRFIETTQGNLYTIAEHLFMHGQGASAARAKTALRVLRRSVSCRLALDPREGIDREMDKSQRGCPGVLSTHRTMANYRPKRRSNGAISNRTTKTSTFKCNVINHSDP
jgi:hypothetical protein